jgi:hypothetical protein
MSRTFCNVLITLFVVLPESAYGIPAALIHLTAFGQSPPPPSTLTWEVGGNTLSLTGLQPTIIETPFGLFPTDAQSDWVITRENASQYGVDFDAWASTLRDPSKWPVSRLIINGNVGEHQVLGRPGVFTLNRLELHINYPFFTTPDLIAAHTGAVNAFARGDLRLIPEPSSGVLVIIVVASVLTVVVSVRRRR